MKWNWELKEWPEFVWDSSELADLEANFLKGVGELAGLLKFVGSDSRDRTVAKIITDEAINTSKIEGEILDRASVQSSIERNFGLSVVEPDIPSRERGIASLLTDLHQNFKAELTHSLLFKWHKLLFEGDTKSDEIGQYRSGNEAMRIVSGRIDKPKMHFEAPPSSTMTSEMNRFLN